MTRPARLVKAECNGRQDRLQGHDPFRGKLFGINFALGVATGITLEFQFGANWACDSHYVGDEFGYAVGEAQQTRLAAIEVMWRTEPAAAAFNVFAIPTRIACRILAVRIAGRLRRLLYAAFGRGNVPDDPLRAPRPGQPGRRALRWRDPPCRRAGMFSTPACMIFAAVAMLSLQRWSQ